MTAPATAVELRTLLARAFADDPLMRWIFPDDGTRPHACAALFGLFAEHYLAVGAVEVAGALPAGGAAMWRGPEHRAQPAESLPTMGGLMTTLLGLGRSGEVADAMARVRTARSPQDHLYLHFLAVDPAAQGRGLGRELLGRVLAAGWTAGLPVHLETTMQRNVGFYEAAGFAVSGELSLAPGGPTVWLMTAG